MFFSQIERANPATKLKRNKLPKVLLISRPLRMYETLFVLSVYTIAIFE